MELQLIDKNRIHNGITCEICSKKEQVKMYRTSQPFDQNKVICSPFAISDSFAKTNFEEYYIFLCDKKDCHEFFKLMVA